VAVPAATRHSVTEAKDFRLSAISGISGYLGAELPPAIVESFHAAQ